jgi:hypothetical protein
MDPDPDPGGPKTRGSGVSATLFETKALAEERIKTTLSNTFKQEQRTFFSFIL